MGTFLSLLKEGKTKEAWQMYGGFIYLSPGEFSQLQERLLQEQLELAAPCGLARKLAGGNLPKNTRDFRRHFPLTTYEDYAPFLSEKREDLLPARPELWICTSGKAGKYDRKWAPYTTSMVTAHAKNFLAAIIFSVSSREGAFTLRENCKFLYGMAPPPYLTGMVPYGLKREFPFEYLPPLQEAEKMSFEDRNKEGFRLGLIKGVDLFFGLSSVLVRIGEEFTGKKPEKTVKPGRFNLLAWSRLARGMAKSRLNSRSILPKDVWNLKGIICAGTDTAFYKDRIEHYWGKKPVEIYGGTEIGIAATQTWDHEGMVLFPDANFWEFIPEEEYFKERKNPGYAPQTVLADELEPGKRYEIVVTNFRGGAFLRYRVGDFIKVLALKNERLGIDLPQIIYEDRADDVIDLAGFTRITERTLWDALKKAGITHGNWVAKKSFSGEHPVIELHLELPLSEKAAEFEQKIHQALRQVDTDYHDLEEILGYRPVKIAPVPEGFFKACRERQRAASAGDRLPEHFSRINPPDGLFKELAVFRAQKQLEGGQRRS